MIWSVIISVALFFALLGGLKAGGAMRRRLGGAEEEGAGSAAADGVVFAVLGLLIAFTFTTSASKFDERRRLIVQQVNALGTAHLRLDLLSPEERTAIRARLAEWLDLALEARRFTKGEAERQAAVAQADRIQNDIWRLTLAAVDRQQQPALTAFVMAPINEWIDLSTTRLAMNDLGLPPLVLPTLIILSLLGSLLAGSGMSGRTGGRTLHRLAFAGAVSFSIYVILDLNEPRAGLINVDAVDETMLQLRRSIAPTTQPIS